MADKDFVDGMRRILLEKKKSIEENITSELSEMREGEGHHLADMDDLGSDAFDEATAFQIMEMESATLEQINNALQLIDDGKYGACEECEKKIGLERLKALPFATLCISCKQAEEGG